MTTTINVITETVREPLSILPTFKGAFLYIFGLLISSCLFIICIILFCLFWIYCVFFRFYVFISSSCVMIALLVWLDTSCVILNGLLLVLWDKYVLINYYS